MNDWEKLREEANNRWERNEWERNEWERCNIFMLKPLNGPQLTEYEQELDRAGIEHRRNGTDVEVRYRNLMEAYKVYSETHRAETAALAPLREVEVYRESLRDRHHAPAPKVPEDSPKQTARPPHKTLDFFASPGSVIGLYFVSAILIMILGLDKVVGPGLYCAVLAALMIIGFIAHGIRRELLTEEERKAEDEYDRWLSGQRGP